MADEVTKIMIPESTGGNDMASMMAMMNNGGLGGSNWIWVLFLFMLYGKNGLTGANNVDQAMGTDLLMQAINGNKDAISSLATTLNSDFNSVNTAITSLQSQVQSGFCGVNNAITTQGYQNQLATSELTAIIGSKIDAQTTAMNELFCALKEREMQSHIDELIEKNSALKSQIDNAQQTAQIQAYVASLITPLQAEVTAIKAAQPATTTVQYPQLTAVPTSYLYGYGTSLYNGAWA